jgi:hypothetical protein
MRHIVGSICCKLHPVQSWLCAAAEEELVGWDSKLSRWQHTSVSEPSESESAAPCRMLISAWLLLASVTPC